MGQTKGIAIRIDDELLHEIENHKLSRNELVKKAIESYLHPMEKKSKSKTSKKQPSAWSKIEEDAEKLNSISKQPSKQTSQSAQQEPVSTETITDNLYHEIYSTIYNTEVSPLKKQIELKNDLITTLQEQNKITQEDKQFLYNHIKQLEERIPKKRSLFRKRANK